MGRDVFSTTMPYVILGKSYTREPQERHNAICVPKWHRMIDHHREPLHAHQ